MTDLEKTREEINRINDEILSLFVRRMELSVDVHRYKKAHGLPTTDPAREAAIMETVAEKAGPVYRPYAQKLFRALIDLSKEYQDSLE